jgi:hypothetical protein
MLKESRRIIEKKKKVIWEREGREKVYFNKKKKIRELKN